MKILIQIRQTILISILFISNVFTQEFWQQTNGPEGGRIENIYINSLNHIYALNKYNINALYRSMDNGINWTQIDESFSYQSIAFNTNNDIFASSQGVIISTDNGNTWTKINNVLSVKTLGINSNDDIFAGTFNDGIYRSTDNGNNWTQINNGLTSLQLNVFVFKGNNTIFVGTNDGGVFRSTDNGDNWTQINNGLTGTNVTSFAVNNSGDIFVGINGEGVFRSTDDGNNWTHLNSLSQPWVTSIAINNNDIFVGISGGGVYRSTDNGINWTEMNNGLLSKFVRSLSINNNTIFLGCDAGIFVSTDNGNSWNQSNNGIITTEIYALASDNNNFIYAGTQGAGTFRSNDNGNNWIQINNGMLKRSIFSFVIGTNYIFAGTVNVVYRSSDNGDNWIQINNGLPPSIVRTLAMNNNDDIFAGADENIFRSTDNGDNWTQVYTGTVNVDVYAISINSNDVIFACTNGDGVFRSTDNGNSWTQINNGLTTLDILSILIKNNDIFIGTDSGIFLSSDNGDNWNEKFPNYYSRALTINDNNVIYAATGYSGAHRSEDYGENWTQIEAGLLGNSKYISSLTITNDDYILAGTWFGAFISTTTTILEIPQLSLPTNGEIDVSTNPILQWNTVTGANSFYLQVSEDSLFTNIVYVQEGITSNSHQVMDLNGYTTYYWRIKAINVSGSSLWSQEWSFATKFASPVLLSPTDGVTGIPLNPTFEWNIVINATEYRLQLAYDLNFNNIARDNQGLFTSFQHTGLDPEMIYFWRVNSTDGTNFSDWSEPWSFTTYALPVLTIQNATNISDVSAQLNGSVNPNGHQVAVGFEWGEDNSYGNFEIASPDTFTGNVDQFVTAEVGWLRTNWDYHYRVVVDQVEGEFTIFGDDQMFHTQSYPANINLSTNIPFPSYDNPSDYSAAEYRIFGLPGRKDLQLDITNILTGDHGTVWQAYWDNGTYSSNSGDYLIEFDGSENFRLGDGNAIWLINKGNFSIDISGIQTMSTDGDDNVRIGLHNGWNLITCPFTRQVPWWAIQQINSIANPIYEFTGGWNTSQDLTPYQGYIFDNTNNLTELVVPYGATLPKPILGTQYDWRIKIALLINEYKDKSSYLGVSEQSEIGRDQLDFRKPHAVGSVPSVYFEREEWDINHSSYATDIRPPINEIEKWEFSVSATPGENAELVFNEFQDVPTNFEIILLDHTNLKYEDLRKDNSYQFKSVTEITIFELLVGDKKYIEQEISAIIPLEFSLGKNFPNPFNPSTIIPVSIPKESELTLKVYNVLGQEIRTIYNGTKETGKHYFKWDGKNYLNQQVAAGIYLYRLNTEKGQTFVGKMMLVK